MEGRVVLVTGASSGIGAAVTRLLTGGGDHVVAVARSAEGLLRMASGSPSITVAPADVLDEAALVAVVEQTVATHGRLDAVVHAAQVMAYGRIEDLPAEVFERVVDTAVHGTANVVRAVMPTLRAQGKGTFVIVNSLLGSVATPGMGAYDTGKWGQLGLARVLRLETRDAPGIHVCTVAPGAVNTAIYDAAANYAARGGFPPPPVISPERVATRIVGLLDRPRRHVNAGPVNTLTILAFRLLPSVYERVVGPLVARYVFKGVPNEPNDGNVFTPVPATELDHGRWSLLGRATRAGFR